MSNAIACPCGATPTSRKSRLFRMGKANQDPARLPDFHICEETAQSIFENFCPSEYDAQDSRQLRLNQLYAASFRTYFRVFFWGDLEGGVPLINPDKALMGCCAFHANEKGPGYSDKMAVLRFVMLEGVGKYVEEPEARKLAPTAEIEMEDYSVYIYVLGESVTDPESAKSLVALGLGVTTEVVSNLKNIILCLPVGKKARWSPHSRDTATLVQWNPHLRYSEVEIRAHLSKLDTVASRSRMEAAVQGVHHEA